MPSYLLSFLQKTVYRRIVLVSTFIKIIESNIYSEIIRYYYRLVYFTQLISIFLLKNLRTKWAVSNKGGIFSQWERM